MCKIEFLRVDILDGCRTLDELLMTTDKGINRGITGITSDYELIKEMKESRKDKEIELYYFDGYYLLIEQEEMGNVKNL